MNSFQHLLVRYFISAYVFFCNALISLHLIVKLIIFDSVNVLTN